MLVVEFPDAGVRFPPPLLDRVGGDFRRPPVVVPSMSCRSAAANSDSASPTASSWNWPRTQLPARARPPGNPRSRSAFSPPMGSPATVYPGIRPGPSASSRSLTNRTAPASSGCGPWAATASRVALVPDPGVAVVVVAPALKPLGQRRGGRRHHGTAGRGQPAQYRVGVPRVRGRDQVVAVGRDAPPGFLGGRPALAGVGGLRGEFTVGDLQNEIVLRPFRQADPHLEAAVGEPRPARARPAEPGAAAAAGPRLPLPLQARHPAPAELRAQVEDHADLRRPVEGLDPAQQHRRCGSAGMARASRHSILVSPTHRLRQIRLPFS